MKPTKPPVDNHEADFRNTGRTLAIVFVFGVLLVWLIGYGLGKLFDSGLPLLLSGFCFIVVLLVLSVRRFTAYYRWTKKYPFYWLFRR